MSAELGVAAVTAPIYANIVLEEEFGSGQVAAARSAASRLRAAWVRVALVAGRSE